jgi:hypothetical protein
MSSSEKVTNEQWRASCFLKRSGVTLLLLLVEETIVSPGIDSGYSRLPQTKKIMCNV